MALEIFSIVSSVCPKRLPPNGTNKSPVFGEILSKGVSVILAINFL